MTKNKSEMIMTEFDGFASQMRNSPWLACEDLDAAGGARKFQVENTHEVKNAAFDKGQKKDGYAISFVGAKKKLFLNSTNRKFLRDNFGQKTSGWREQWVELYIQENIQVYNNKTKQMEKTRGLRLRLPQG